MQQVLGFATLGLLGFDVVCIIIALAIDYWILLDNDISKIYAGLWRICTEIKVLSSGTNCADVNDTTEIETVRAMLFLGLFLVCGAIACIVLKLFVLKEKKELLYGSTGLLGLGGLFLMIGFAVYHKEIYDDLDGRDYELHAGFAFNIIAWLLTWVGAGISAAMLFMKE